jgi:hypothetical protein
MANADGRCGTKDAEQHLRPSLPTEFSSDATRQKYNTDYAAEVKRQEEARRRQSGS